MSIAEEIEESIEEEISGADDLLKSSHSGVSPITLHKAAGFPCVETKGSVTSRFRQIFFKT